MTSDQKYEGTVEEWDSGVLGNDEAHVVVAPDQAKALDEALGLHPISIRVQRSLLEDLKALAQLNGIGYQPLMRQILTRWVDAEKRSMLMDRLQKQRADAKSNAAKATVEAASPSKRVTTDKKARQKIAA